MKKLIIDTSTDYLYIAIISNEEIINDYFVKGNNNHSENLIDCLTNLLEKTKLTIDDFDGIYVGRGPGSYTGLRVSGTVAKVLAYVKNIPFYSFSSLDLVATPYLKANGYYLSKIRAKKDHHYVKVIHIVESQYQEVIGDSFMEDGEMEKIISSYDGIIVTDPTLKFNPLVLFAMGLMKKEESLHTYVPNYLRKEL